MCCLMSARCSSVAFTWEATAQGMKVNRVNSKSLIMQFIGLMEDLYLTGHHTLLIPNHLKSGTVLFEYVHDFECIGTERD